MKPEAVLAEFRAAGALLEGHFILRSGRHSRQFFQCALLLQYPDKAERLCQALAQRLDPAAFDSVISPALGGLFVGHELAKALGKRHIFAEKENGALVLRRGFEISPGERFLVAEDVITSGGRVAETIAIVRGAGGVPVAAAALVHRGDSEPQFGCPFHSLLRLQVESFDPAQLPPDLAAIPAEKPGSR
ncbi:MAG TPA: orotate phosphoribosyltransferase [Verrucomicrobiae bacterium]|nr:orotate phosphoribosyltransferase [Verrucomicrobiae bacterium]